MVYQNNFVATVKVGKKILRENQNTVTVPFGSEYSIYLKNLSTVRALVRVSVDGQDATEGVWLIVPANSPLELERFIKNGNMYKGNRFKFIERTGQIEEHRGVGAEDGLIRVEYKFEQLQPLNVWPNQTAWVWNNGGVTYGSGGNNLQGGQFNVGSVTTTNATSNTVHTKSPFRSAEPMMKSSITRSMTPSASAAKRKLSESFTETSCNFASMEAPLNDAGITVAGSESSQSFTQGAWFPTEDASHTLILKMVGKVGSKPVVQAVTVQQKPVCSTCGKVNKATFKFCGRCGTSLVIL
jgi:hypothetical protein